MRKEIPVRNEKLARVLVTGGAGFIGSHFCDHAIKRGAQVVAFDNLSTGRMEFLDGALKNSSFQLVKGDVRELSEIEKACVEFRPTLIAHGVSYAARELTEEKDLNASERGEIEQAVNQELEHEVTGDESEDDIEVIVDQFLDDELGEPEEDAGAW